MSLVLSWPTSQLRFSIILPDSLNCFWPAYVVHFKAFLCFHDVECISDINYFQLITLDRDTNNECDSSTISPNTISIPPPLTWTLPAPIHAEMPALIYIPSRIPIATENHKPEKTFHSPPTLRLWNRLYDLVVFWRYPLPSNYIWYLLYDVPNF